MTLLSWVQISARIIFLRIAFVLAAVTQSDAAHCLPQSERIPHYCCVNLCSHYSGWSVRVDEMNVLETETSLASPRLVSMWPAEEFNYCRVSAFQPNMERRPHRPPLTPSVPTPHHLPPHPPTPLSSYPVLFLPHSPHTQFYPLPLPLRNPLYLFVLPTLVPSSQPLPHRSMEPTPFSIPYPIPLIHPPPYP